MTRRDWYGPFVHEAADRPSIVIKTIARVRPEEVGAVGTAVGLIANPRVQVLGYAALARRSPAHRADLLVQAAASAELIEHVRPRVGALGALFDALPATDAAHYYARMATFLDEHDAEELAQHMDQWRFYVERWRRRASRAGIERAEHRVGIARPTMDLKLVAVPGMLEDAVARGRGLGDARFAHIRAFEPARASSPIRLTELATSIGIDPASFEFTPPSGLPIARRGRGRVAVTEPAVQKDRVVNTGFADLTGEPVALVVSPGELHHFFIDIGERLEGAFESRYELSPDLAPDSTIDVVMFTNEDGLAIEGPTTGQFTIRESGDVVVSRRAASLEGDDDLHLRRLFFAFRAPTREGRCSMRCSFYYRGALLQSRYIGIPVGLGKIASVVADYVSSRTLSPRLLASRQPPSLSMMANANGDGTHSFRFYTVGDETPRSSSFNELEIKSHIERARQALRFVSWGTVNEWTPSDEYAFAAGLETDAALPHLRRLARQGRVLWDAVIDKLTGGPVASEALRERMRAHGRVELALKEGANMVLPVALFYDHAIDTSANAVHTLCQTFVGSLGRRLEDEPCFNGNCPHREDMNVVCPGGFWGFRHAIGLSVSLGADQTSPPEVGPYISNGAPSLVAGVSTDPDMSSVEPHLVNIGLNASVEPHVFTTRDDTIDAMKNAGSPIVYFYCHGGKDQEEGPYLEIGPKGGLTIAQNTLRGNKVFWNEVRPIVFMNGCYTTSVSPEEALGLVNGFMRVSGASGVVGTEITIFETLAAPFAERFFREFVVNRQSVGEAIRRSRLRLLKESLNPLGLAYIPFAHASLLLQSALATGAATTTIAPA